MNKPIIFTTLLSTAAVLLSGCSTNQGAWDTFSRVLNNAMPYLEESESWDTYSEQVSKQGVVYEKVSASEQQFISKKMNTEYANAIARLSTPFTNEKTADELAASNQGYQFKYNGSMAVKDKTTRNTMGYCVNYDSDRVINGKLVDVAEDEKIRKSFIYLTKDKPLSVATSRHEFIQLVCGNNFYNKYKQ